MCCVLERSVECGRTQRIPAAHRDARGRVIPLHQCATPRFDLSNLTIERVAAEVHDAADQIVSDRGRIEPQVRAWQRPDLFYLRRERNELADASPIERLDSEPVANRVQASALTRIEHQKREHSVKSLGACRTPLHPGGHENFGVAMRSELMPESGELAAKLDVVI